MRYFILFECGKNILNKLDAACDRVFIAISKDKYYTEFCEALTDYNNHKNMPLSNANIWEAIHKVIEEESVDDANNDTPDKFSHASNTKRENTNTIFTSEKLDKLDKLVDVVKNLTTKDAEYYESNTATASNTQGNLTHNTEKLLTLATKTLNKNYWVNGPSLSCPCQSTWGFTKGLRRLYVLHRWKI